jgi:transcription antitermination factor NusG
MSNPKKWFVVYSKPRFEKKLSLLFTENSIENYCPLNKIKKQWSDRIKLVEEPLFKSYVFVKIAETEQQRVRNIIGVVNFVYWLGKPAVIKQYEIDRIKRFLNEYENVSVVQLPPKPAEKVVIVAGIFMDKQAKVLRIKGNKVELEIESLGYKLIATLDLKSINRIQAKSA